MIKNEMNENKKQLLKFKNQLHKLLIKYPEIRLGGTYELDVVAYIPTMDWTENNEIYLPTSGKQEPIKELTANGVPVSL